MSKLFKILVLFAIIDSSHLPASAQASQAPTVTLRGDKMTISGKFAHIDGNMPTIGDLWLYSVESPRPSLFVFSFWLISEFADTKEANYGFYHAKSWTVEVLDSQDHPEKTLIFDSANDMYFWGNLALKDRQARLHINGIKGLPNSGAGPIVLKALR